MTPDEVLAHARRLRDEAKRFEEEVRHDTDRSHSVAGLRAEVLEFLRIAAGPKSAFTQQVEGLPESPDWRVAGQLSAVVESFVGHVEHGLAGAVSVERKAQLDVVSDLLSQAHQLLEDRKAHPAAAAVLIGATLEEFLRGWIDMAGVSLGHRKPGLQNYASALADADLITKQDVKDLTAWAGLRNYAAHGEWGEVEDPARIKLMLESVNLFMRRYGSD